MFPAEMLGPTALASLWNSVFTLLSWDIVKGALVFLLAISLGAQIVQVFSRGLR